MKFLFVVGALLLSATQLFADGPYVFYESGKIAVTMVNGTSVSTKSYSETEPVMLSIPAIGKVPAFSVALRKTHPIPKATWALPGKLLITSDFEGEYEAFVTLMKYSGVIDNELNWSYGANHLVINGDMFDRGSYVTELLWLIYKMQGEARAAGGEVHYIVGNHDYMNLTGDYRYVDSTKYFASAKAMGKSYADLYTNQTELGRWIRSFNAIEQIGDYTVVHGGFSPVLVDKKYTVSQINTEVRNGLNGKSSTAVTDVTGSTSGVFWYRGFFKAGDGKYPMATQSDINKVVSWLNTKRIVVGHTITETVALHFGGAVVAMDIHHAETYPSYVEAFLIENGAGKMIRTNGIEKTLFTDQVEPVLYGLTVQSGSGSGSFAKGTVQSIVAHDSSKVYKVFTHWSGAKGVIDDSTKATAKITMPAQNLTVKANYKTAAVIDTSDWSRDFVTIGLWSSSADQLGTTVLLDTSSEASLAFTASVVADRPDPVQYSWGKITGVVKGVYDKCDYLSITYTATDSFALVLDNAQLSEQGVSHSCTLPKSTSSKSVLIAMNAFVQPAWTPDSLKTTLDPTKVESISLEAISKSSTTNVVLHDLRLNRFKEDIVALTSQNTAAIEPFTVIGNSVVFAGQSGISSVELFALNGRRVFAAVNQGDRSTIVFPKLSGVHILRVASSGFVKNVKVGGIQ